jgi:hypothetical protein
VVVVVVDDVDCDGDVEVDATVDGQIIFVSMSDDAFEQPASTVVLLLADKLAESASVSRLRRCSE